MLINKIAVSKEFEYSHTGFKYFIGYRTDNIVRPLYIILPQMGQYTKYCDNGRKNISFMIEDDGVLIKYNDIWNKIEKLSNISRKYDRK